MSALDPTEIIRSPRLDIANRVNEMDTAMLRDELKRALAVTAETIAYLGEIWRELERRGENLTEFRVGMGQYLPLVAAGQLDPAAMVRFTGRISLLRAIQTLPITDQRRLAAGEKVKVYKLDMEGKPSTQEVPATALTAEQIRMVFDAGRLRPVDEQANMIESARLAARRRGRMPAARRYRVHIDQDKRTAKIGRMTLPVQEIVDALIDAGVIPGPRQ